MPGLRSFAAAAFLCTLQVPGVIHFHTTASNGKQALHEYAQRAAEKGIGVLVVTDTYCQRVEYGIGPMRRWFKKAVELKSVFGQGPEYYLDTIRQVNDSFPGVTIVPGVECAPFYYWSGSYWKRTLTVHNLEKELLVIGLKDPSDYLNLPVVATGKSRYDQYHGEQYILPYQDLIDYVDAKGGLTFWTSPEARTETVLGKVKASTEPYPDDLLRSRDYTGFSVFYEGYEMVGKPGGVWDRVLTEYCGGKRKKPVWAIGELDDHGTGDRRIDDVTTVFLMEARGEKEYLRALREGSMYAVYKVKGGLRLDEFSVKTTEGTSLCGMGGETSWEPGAAVCIRLSRPVPLGERLTVELVQEGRVVGTYAAEDKVEAMFEIPAPAAAKTYFRLDAKDGFGNHLISNPFFVTRPEFDKQQGP